MGLHEAIRKEIDFMNSHFLSKLGTKLRTAESFSFMIIRAWIFMTFNVGISNPKRGTLKIVICLNDDSKLLNISEFTLSVKMNEFYIIRDALTTIIWYYLTNNFYIFYNFRE